MCDRRTAQMGLQQQHPGAHPRRRARQVTSNMSSWITTTCVRGQFTLASRCCRVDSTISICGENTSSISKLCIKMQVTIKLSCGFPLMARAVFHTFAIRADNLILHEPAMQKIDLTSGNVQELYLAC